MPLAENYKIQDMVWGPKTGWKGPVGYNSRNTGITGMVKQWNVQPAWETNSISRRSLFSFLGVRRIYSFAKRLLRHLRRLTFDEKLKDSFWLISFAQFDFLTQVFCGVEHWQPGLGMFPIGESHRTLGGELSVANFGSTPTLCKFFLFSTTDLFFIVKSITGTEANLFVETIFEEFQCPCIKIDLKTPWNFMLVSFFVIVLFFAHVSPNCVAIKDPFFSIS